jgi:hypothetical protein
MRQHLLAAVAFSFVSGLALTAPALAAPAQSNVSLNVRTGPSTAYAVVDVLYPGEPVEVTSQTSNGWCAIQHNGPDGCVSCRYLTPTGPGYGNGGYDDDDDEPNVNFSINTPNFSFSIGNNPPGYPQFPGYPGYPGNNRDRVCFFEHNNYEGRSFCARPGQGDRSLGNFWNDRISSIRIFGDAWVRVCQHDNFDNCRNFYSSRSSLGRLNDEISSFIVQN